MSPLSHPGWESDLVELLERQRGLYAQLQTLAVQQERIVAAADPDLPGLSRLSTRRRNLVDQLARIAQRIEPYRRNWPTAWPSLPPDARARILDNIAQVQNVLDSMLRREPNGRGERCA